MRPVRDLACKIKTVTPDEQNLSVSSALHTRTFTHTHTCTCTHIVHTQEHAHEHTHARSCSGNPVVQGPAVWQRTELGWHLVYVDVQGRPGSRSFHSVQLQLLQVGGCFAVQGGCSWAQLYSVARGKEKAEVQMAAGYGGQRPLQEPASQVLFCPSCFMKTGTSDVKVA